MLPAPLEPIDVRLTSWMARHGVTLRATLLLFRQMPGTVPDRVVAT